MQFPLDAEGPRGQDHGEHAYAVPLMSPWLRFTHSFFSAHGSSLLISGQAGLQHVVESTCGSHHSSRQSTLTTNRVSLCNCGCIQGGTHPWLFYFPLPCMSTKPAQQYVPSEPCGPAPLHLTPVGLLSRLLGQLCPVKGSRSWEEQGRRKGPLYSFSLNFLSSYSTYE